MDEFTWEITEPVKRLEICGHCGREMGDYEGGSGSYNMIPLCHPNVDTRPDCYKLVSLEHHHLPCDELECINDRKNRGVGEFA